MRVNSLLGCSPELLTQYEMKDRESVVAIAVKPFPLSDSIKRRTG